MPPGCLPRTDRQVSVQFSGYCLRVGFDYGLIIFILQPESRQSFFPEILMMFGQFFRKQTVSVRIRSHPISCLLSGLFKGYPALSPTPSPY